MIVYQVFRIPDAIQTAGIPQAMIKHDHKTMGLYNLKFHTIGKNYPIARLSTDRPKVKGDHVAQNF